MEKIAIIIHSLNDLATELCLLALQEVEVPENCEMDVLAIRGDCPRGQIYKDGQQKVTADYRIFLDENAVITDKNIICKIVDAFRKNDKLGILGVSGAKVLLSDGVALTSPKRSGCVYDEQASRVRRWSSFACDYEECMVVDGYLFASRVEIPWRNDLFDDDVFLVSSACVEIGHQGYISGVIRQDIPAIAYRGNSYKIDRRCQRKFLDEYYKEVFPLVSVIIPQYERVEWFFEALESVLHQTYRNLDIFVTDNSHNTETADRIKPYLAKDKRIKYEHHPDYDSDGNWGRAMSYNNPQAEYVNWLMNDDLWHPDKIRRMVDCFLANENIGLVTSVRKLIDAEGRQLKNEAVFAQMPIEQTGIIDGRSAGKRMLDLMINYIGEPTTVLVQKECMLEGYRLGFSGKEGKYIISDFPTWLHILAQKDMIYICEPLSSMRIHENQQQRDLKVMIRGMICWIMEMKYAWEQGVFFESRQDLFRAEINWRNAASRLVDSLAENNTADEEIVDLVKWINKVNGLVSRLQKCACCKCKMLYYSPLPRYYTEMAKQHGASGTWKSEMLNDREYMCPRCGAADRERAYALWMERELPRDSEITILDIAPANSLRNFIKNTFPLADYKTMDLFMPGVDYKMDIMDMNLLPDKSVDFFICSHVLEHVRDDRKAMRELRRILKDDGRGILVVPIDLNRNSIDEDPDCTDVAERWRRFGQDDYVRCYSKQGYLDRLTDSGLAVEQITRDYFGEDADLNALTETATVYIVSRTAD